MCGNIACAVVTLDSEEDIPPVWRAEELSKLEGPKAGHPGKQERKERPKSKPLQGELGHDVDESCVVEYDEECDNREYCEPEDEDMLGKGDYVSLLGNPERFTGYSGAGARSIWNAIYRENCFLKEESEDISVSPAFSGFGEGNSNLKAQQNFLNVFQKQKNGQAIEPVQQNVLYPLDDECLEKRVFHRVISGMHASISAHLCWEYFNQKTGQWSPNVSCYETRLHNYPERISNVYFNYALVARAVSKIQKHLDHYTYCSGDPKEDRMTKTKVLRLTNALAGHPRIFDESLLFRDVVAQGLKDDIRNRFRNVSRLMDCIGCDKCRLWGKLQAAGYGAALKILFEFDETKNGENPPLRRTELVALINTLGRLVKSVGAIQRFEQTIENGSRDDFPTQTSRLPALSQSRQPAAKKSAERPSTEKKPVATESRMPRVNVINSHSESQSGHETSKNPPPDVGGSAYDEAILVFKAFAWVFKSWIGLPKLVGSIFIMEMRRLWNYWLGLPVPGRSWEFRYPTRDEL